MKTAIRPRRPKPHPLPQKYRKLAATSAAAILAALLGACDASDGGPADGGDSPGGKIDEADTDGAGESDVVEVAPEFAEALDVDKASIVIDLEAVPPEFYSAPRGLEVSLGGTEFWQRWPGGHSPTFSYSEGTEQGRRCMQASAIRFEAIMSDPPESVLRLQAETNWGGSFFNWVDDFTQSDFSQPTSARLWAWRTGLIKWISQTGADGTCMLPTLEMVETMAANCLATAAANDGEIQGCRN